MNFIMNAIAAITGYISGPGTGCAGRIWGLRRLSAIGALLSLAAMSPSLPPPTSTLKVNVEGLRDNKGKLLFCLTRRTADFLACDKDPAAVHGSVFATSPNIEFDHMAPGEWALLMVHDSNSNGTLDKRFGIPREGFGFSRNPAIRFGPPSAGDVRFEVPVGLSEQRVKMRYIF